MNPDAPTPPRQELEARLTALLLGELTPDQAASVRRAMEQDPALARLHERLRRTIELVGQAEAAARADTTSAATEPLHLSAERRQKLLARFKVVTPAPFRPGPRQVRPVLQWAAAAAVVVTLAWVTMATRLAAPKAQAPARDAAGRWVGLLENLPTAPAVRPASDAPVPPLIMVGEKFQHVEKGIQVARVQLRKDESSALYLPAQRRSEEGESQRGAPAKGVLPVAQPADPQRGYFSATQIENLAATSAAQEGKTAGGAAGATGLGLGRGLVNRVEVAAASERDSDRGDALAPSAGESRRAGSRPHPEAALEWVAGVSAQAQGKAGAAPAPPHELERGRLARENLTFSMDAQASRPRSQFMAPMRGSGTVEPPLEPATTSEPTTAGRSIQAGNLVPRRSERGVERMRSLVAGKTPLAAGEVSVLAAPLPSIRAELHAQAPTTADVEQKLPVEAEFAGVPLSPPPPPSAPAPAPATTLTIMAGQAALADGAVKLGEIDDDSDEPQPAPERFFGGFAGGGKAQEPELPVVGDTPALGYRFGAVSQEGRGASPPTDSKSLIVERRSRATPPASAAGKPITITEEDAHKEKSETEALPRKLAEVEDSLRRVTGLLSPTTNRLRETAQSEAFSQPIAAPASKEDAVPARPAQPAPVPQPEVFTTEDALSTFSLNVSDVSFKLAGASLEQGRMPEPASVRGEEFINAFDYRDPEAPLGVPVAFAWERARYPFAHNRDLLRFSVKTAAAGRQAGRALNLVLLLDNSGSMERADRVRIIQESLRVLAAQLQPQDRISIVTFSRTARLWVDDLPGHQAGEMLQRIGQLTPEGGTNLEEAMNLAYQTAARHYLAGGINRVVLLTDGAANLGNVDPAALKQKVESQRKQGLALDCFGIGWEGFNDDLLEVLSRNGDGRYGFVNSPEAAATEFAGQLAGALQVAASDVKVQVEFNPRRTTVWRQIGYTKHQLTKEQFRDNTVDAAEIAAQEAGNALYVVEVNLRGEGPMGVVRVRYKIPGTAEYHEHEWIVPYTGAAVALERASPAMRLAAAASAFSEWLGTSPFAGEVTPDRLLGLLSGVPEVYGADARPKRLEWMIRQAKSLAGK